PVASAFAGVITRAAMRAGERVLLRVLPPGCLVVAGLCQGEPCLNVLARRTGVVAGRKVIDIHGALPSTRAGALADRLLVDRRQIFRNETHGCPRRGSILDRRTEFRLVVVPVISGVPQTACQDDGGFAAMVEWLKAQDRQANADRAVLSRAHCPPVFRRSSSDAGNQRVRCHPARPT